MSFNNKVIEMNIRFEYLYRDAGNNKNWGEIVFTNTHNLSSESIAKKPQDNLIDGSYFYACKVDVAELFFDSFDSDLDHDWHEFHAITCCSDEANDKQGRDVSGFIQELQGHNLLAPTPVIQ